MSSVLSTIEELGFDVNQLMNRIADMIVKTVIAGAPSITHVNRSCLPNDVENEMIFQVMGFDVMLDKKCRPWLLEVNHAPSFKTDSPLDYKIKKTLIVDTLKLL